MNPIESMDIFECYFEMIVPGFHNLFVYFSQRYMTEALQIDLKTMNL